MKLVYLPIDSRPCNARFPVQLLQCAGVDCVVPPMQDMDYFTQPSDHNKIWSFLVRETKEADVLILAVDQLAYGSLLASRENDVSVQEALRRVQAITRLKEANPALRIFGFSIIMRASTSTLKKEDIVHHHAVTAYSQAAHRAQMSGTDKEKKEAEDIAATIPAAVLQKYHEVRERNHAINRACVAFTSQGVMEHLLLLQEDSQPFGFHKLEQKVLLEEIEKSGVKDRVVLHNGTDEGGCLCAAKVAASPFKLYVHELGGGECGFIAKYEDRPFMENIQSHCKFAGIALTNMQDADKILCVLTPGNEPQKDVLSPAAESSEIIESHNALARELASLLAFEKPVALLDVYYANGGSASFMEALSKQMDVLKLSAYAAWNTASNALGTVLAQLALGNEQGRNAAFTVERLLDDLVYQSTIREQLESALAEVGEDPYHLQNKTAAESLLRVCLHQAIQQNRIFAQYDIEADAYLPWPRTFEAGITLQKMTGSQAKGEKQHG